MGNPHPPWCGTQYCFLLCSEVSGKIEPCPCSVDHSSELGSHAGDVYGRCKPVINLKSFLIRDCYGITSFAWVQTMIQIIEYIIACTWRNVDYFPAFAIAKIWGINYSWVPIIRPMRRSGRTSRWASRMRCRLKFRKAGNGATVFCPRSGIFEDTKYHEESYLFSVT